MQAFVIFATVSNAVIALQAMLHTSMVVKPW
jgi:hypothetical protein